METRTSKIFGIGLSKTGTTSLANALELLGYKTRDYIGVDRYSPGDLACVDLDAIEENDALTDTPIPSFYRDLDIRYPRSKFILTVRDREGWTKSCRKQFTQRHADHQNDAHKRLFVDLYGTDIFDEQKFVRGYESFVSGVLEYFKDRPHDLLVIDIAAGEGWQKLCPFLDKPLPDVPFPMANVTQIRWINIGDIATVARRAGEEIRDTCDAAASQPWPSMDKEFAVRVPWASVLRAPSRLWDRAVGAIGGARNGALKRAEKRAFKQIIKGLKRLTPQMPVISPMSNALPPAQRTKYNHLWLVDPLNRPTAFDNNYRALTVNIALVEDGRPICGVVYAPLIDVMYYAKAGQGSFKVERRGEPAKLTGSEQRVSSESKLVDPTRVAPDFANVDINIRAGNDMASLSHALAICHVAEGRASAYRSSQPTMEWEIAAAHAVAKCVGKVVRDCSSNNELAYNKQVLRSACIVVD